MTGNRVKLNLKKAVYLQNLLSKKVVRTDCFKSPIRYVAGVDVAYLGGYGIGSAVIIDYKSLEPIEEKHAIIRIDIPYIPTFLAFREMPPMIKAIKSLDVEPDIILVDAHGIMHPRGLGAASHIGIVLELPTIGVAKSKLIGEVMEDGYIYYKGRLVGYRMGKKIYVSIGHKISLESAIRIVSDLTIHNIPEPTRLAHNYANEVKSQLRLKKHWI